VFRRSDPDRCLLEEVVLTAVIEVRWVFTTAETSRLSSPAALMASMIETTFGA